MPQNKNRKILRLPAVEERVQLKSSAIYEAINRGEFPRPFHLTEGETGKGAVAWTEDEIDTWIEARIKKRDEAKLKPKSTKPAPSPSKPKARART
jgi:prophage regulatory protein